MSMALLLIASSGAAQVIKRSDSSMKMARQPHLELERKTLAPTPRQEGPGMQSKFSLELGAHLAAARPAW